MTQIVIVGSGLAGHTAAAEIRARAPDAKLTVVGSELGLPYDRPPLSKEYLLNGAADRPTLSKSHVYGNGIELLQEVSVVEIDRTRRSVQLSNGESRDYDRLLLATGSRPRHLPDSPADSRRVHYLRTLSDANGLRSALEVARTIVIIGGGFVGLEVAAAARSRNCEVVVFERATRLLSRSASVPLSRFAQATHEAKGNKVILGAVITRIIEENEEVRIVWNGGTLHADLAVIGIGVVPNVELAAQCGLTVDDGIVVDSHCRTSDPEVFAAGEVTNYPIVGLGTRIRSESWSVSHAQAAVAARNMLGEDLEFTEMPWLWSDQYDHNIQCLGLLGKADRYYRINDPSSSRWLLLGISRDDRIVGAEALNMGREMSALRRAVRRDEPAPREIMKEAIPYREMDEEK